MFDLSFSELNEKQFDLISAIKLTPIQYRRREHQMCTSFICWLFFFLYLSPALYSGVILNNIWQSRHFCFFCVVWMCDNNDNSDNKNAIMMSFPCGNLYTAT